MKWQMCFSDFTVLTLQIGTNIRVDAFEFLLNGILVFLCTL